MSTSAELAQKYVVASIRKTPSGPSHLFLVKNPPSDFNLEVESQDLVKAVMRHCKTTREQLSGSCPPRGLVLRSLPLITDSLGFPLNVELKIGDYDRRGSHYVFEIDGAVPETEPHTILINRGLDESEAVETIAHEVYHLFFSIRPLLVKYNIDEELQADVFGQLVRNFYRFYITEEA